MAQHLALFMIRERRSIAFFAAAALAAAMLTLLFWFPGRSQAGAPRTVEVSPASGLPGATVTVTGAGGWLASINPPYEIYWDTKGGTLLGEFTPGGDGTWSEDVTIPESASEGAHQIVACEGAGGDFQACTSDAFTVLAEPVPRTLDLDPTSGLPGASVTVTGEGDWLAVNPPFEIFWDTKGGDSLGDFTPGGDGAWDEDVTVPADATSGPHQIVACEGVDGDFQLCISASFTVLAPDRTLDVSPTSALPNTSVTVSGENWLYSVNPPYQIFLDTKGGTLLDDFVVRPDGSWDESVSIPLRTTFGAHQIVACEGVGGDFQVCESVAVTVLAPGGTPTPTPAPAGLTGDADCNGVVNAIDAAYILQYTAGLIGAVPCPELADVNADGSISAVDAALVLQYTAGLLPALPP